MHTKATFLVLTACSLCAATTLTIKPQGGSTPPGNVTFQFDLSKGDCQTAGNGFGKLEGSCTGGYTYTVSARTRRLLLGGGPHCRNAAL